MLVRTPCLANIGFALASADEGQGHVNVNQCISLLLVFATRNCCQDLNEVFYSSVCEWDVQDLGASCSSLLHPSTVSITGESAGYTVPVRLFREVHIVASLIAYLH